MDELKIAQQGVVLTLNELNGELTAFYMRSDLGPMLNLPMLKDTLKDQGYGEFSYSDKVLASFVAKGRESDAGLSMVIGKRLDAEFSISIADNLMAAYLTLVPARGGAALDSVEPILKRLHLEGIIFGILNDQIALAVAAGTCENFLIASGAPVTPGIPGHFRNLLAEKKQDKALADENAVVRFSDLSHLELVRQGDPLLRRMQAVPGIDGTNIKGIPVPAPLVPLLQFGKKSRGAVIDPDDPDLLVAELAGQPVFFRNSVVINGLLEVTDVDLSTGHIDFDGTIRIRGDVKAGMRLKASGDVIVMGMVEAATISAGGNVLVNGGIIGRANSKPGASALPPDTATIDCGGNLQAQFAESARIKANDSILIGAYARLCEMVARNEIVIGRPGAKNCHLGGGTAQATLLIKVFALGTPAGLKTTVQVGSDPYLTEELAGKEAEMQRALADLDQVQKLMAHFKQHPEKRTPAVEEKIEATRKQVAATLFLLVEEKAELAAKLELTQQARIEITESLFEGVEIRIGKHVKRVHDRLGPGTVRLADDGGLVFQH